jgi:FkbM family methyltransferase
MMTGSLSAPADRPTSDRWATLSRYERARILVATKATDSADLPKVAGAGSLIERADGRYQVMHNGLMVAADGYYGPFVTELIERLDGCHEPQEEKVFAQVLESLGPNPTMLELGAYWAYYSMWCLKARPGARVVCVEPIGHRREVGLKNLAANQLTATVVSAAIGATDAEPIEFKTGAEVAMVPVRSVDSLVREHGFEALDILHMDIQGFEHQALMGASDLLAHQRAAWVFISTHRNLEDALRFDLHAKCQDVLVAAGYHIVASHTPEESFSVDGLIVAKRKGAPGPDHVPLQVMTDEIRIWANAQADQPVG